jgi:hypothetical protein
LLVTTARPSAASVGASMRQTEVVTDDAVPRRRVVRIPGGESLADVGLKVIHETVHDRDQLQHAAVELVCIIVLFSPLDLMEPLTQSVPPLESDGPQLRGLGVSVELNQAPFGILRVGRLRQERLDCVDIEQVVKDPVASAEAVVEVIHDPGQPEQLPLDLEDILPDVAGNEPCEQLGRLNLPRQLLVRRQIPGRSVRIGLVRVVRQHPDEGTEHQFDLLHHAKAVSCTSDEPRDRSRGSNIASIERSRSPGPA